MDSYWVPSVNNLGTLGRWAFAGFTEVFQIESDFEARVDAVFGRLINASQTKGAAEQLTRLGGSEPDLQPFARRRAGPPRPATC